MSRSNGLLTGLTAALILGTAPASAVILAEYNFTGGSTAATSVDSGITAGVANFGGWNPGVLSPPNFGSGTDAAFARTDATENTDTETLVANLADALEFGNYLSFTLDGTGYSIDNISYVHSVFTPSDGDTYTSYLLTNRTGATAGEFEEGDQLTLAGVGMPTTTLSGSPYSATVSFDTSLIPELQGITGETEVRIYLSDNRNATNDFHLLDSISVSGVPEPTSLAVLGIFGVFLLSRRRRVA